jgi:hypothetical protein
MDARERAFDPLIVLGCHNSIGPTRLLRARRSAAEQRDELASAQSKPFKLPDRPLQSGTAITAS